MDSFTDVETTNWNAVKLIAVKYGINLKSPEEIRDSMRQHKRTHSTQEDETNSLDKLTISEEEDLGFGTPFRILARPQANGRTVYHLSQRKEEAAKGNGKLQISTSNSKDADEADEAGYDPGLDSPSSSIRKQRRKQPSNRTLRVAKSISAFRVLNASGGSSSAGKSTDSRSQRDVTEENESDVQQRMAQSDVSSVRPDKLQRGDVLGAILGLRQGINADDYSWTEASPRSGSLSASTKSGKGKHREEQQQRRRVSNTNKTSNARPSDGTWRSISPFGAPVLQRDRSASIRNDAMNKWNRSPIPRMADMGQPLFSDMNQMFINSPRAEEDVKVSKDETKPEEDEENDADSISGVSSIGSSSIVESDLIFDVLQNYSQNRQSVRSTASSTSSPAPSSVGSSKHHQRERSANSTEPEENSTSVLPGDDPRFALWAVRNRSEEDDALVLCSRRGEIDMQSHDSPKVPGSPWGVGKRSSVKSSASSNDVNNNKNISSPSPSSKKFTSQDSQHSIMYPKSGAFMIAASMPYIVAELTSHIDNRFMTDFFYTYRAFTTPHELLRLLILRFRWTLKDNESTKESAKRKIVRVRTYVVIKYWITNFFTFDFLPNRRLRTEFTDWLNSSSQDPTLLARPADLAIIKNLKKIVRNLKAAYENVGIGGLLMADAAAAMPTPRIPESNSHPEGLTEAGSDATVNLEMREEGFEESFDSPTIVRSPSDSMMFQKSTPSDHHHHVHAHRAPPPLPTSQGAFSRAFLNTFSRISRFTRHLNARHSINPLLNDTAGSGSEGSSSDAKPCGDLLFVRGGLESFLEYFDLHQSTGSSKVNQAGAAAAQSSGDESQDQASDATYGVEEGTPSLSSNQTRSTPASSFDFHRGSPINNVKANFGLGIQNDEQDEDVGIAITSEDINQFDNTQPRRDSDGINVPQSNSHLSATQDLLHHFQSDQTLRSAMKDEQRSNGLRIESRQRSESRGEDVFVSNQRKHSMPPSSQQQQASNIVQIDDIDLSSDDEEDGMVRKALRRLPGARDLRMAQNVTQLEAPFRQSFESISSLGRVYGGADSRPSLASYYGNDNESNGGEGGGGGIVSETNSEKNVQLFTSTVTSEMLDPDEALRGYELVKGFRIEDLEESDEEESGDVEAALRRLEGVIDEDKQRERARRVERMWERSQAEKKDEKKVEIPKTSSLLRSYEAAAATDLPSDTSSISAHKQQQHASAVPSSTVAIKKSGHSRHPSSVGTAHDVMRARIATETRLPSPQRTKVSTLPVHRSFLLDYRSDVIAQQFSLIEMELFRAVAWQELVTGQWKVRNHRGQVLDWETFYQARARSRVENQKQVHQNDSSSQHTVQLESSIEAITARFNLTCNWVASEIVMTNTLDARAAVVRKLIRIAWKCYHQSNFSTLTQIILGLQSPWIERLGKTWSRVGALEMRMLRDLKAFINPARNFKHLRNAMREMVVAGQMEDLITSTGPPQNYSMKIGVPTTPTSTSATTTNTTTSSSGTAGKGSRSTGIAMNDGCIPFFGLFLSDLAVHDALPTFVEPSLPDAEVNVDPNTGHLTRLADPNAFDHLPKLPKQIQLSPLVNLYKYRILAMTVKTVLALQDRLDAFAFKADKDAYVKALKLRCLEAEQLTVISHVAEP